MAMIYEPRKPRKLGAETREAERAVVKDIKDVNTHGRTLTNCPDCGGKLIRDGGCATCKACGWNACSIR
jgi:uncharacterized Zn finger protein (UPF0148 family)